MTNRSGNPHGYTIKDLHQDLDKLWTAINDINDTLNQISNQIHNQDVDITANDLDDWLAGEILHELRQIREKLS